MPPETGVIVSNPSLFIAVATLALIPVGCGPRNNEINPETSLSEDVAPMHLTDANFQQEVIESEIPVLVDMWAPWCQPCAMMKPTIRELAEELKGKAKVTELNVDENLFSKEKYAVIRYPTLLILSRGQEVKRMIGVQSKQAILKPCEEQNRVNNRTAKSPNQRRTKTINPRQSIATRTPPGRNNEYLKSPAPSIVSSLLRVQIHNSIQHRNNRKIQSEKR